MDPIFIFPNGYPVVSKPFIVRHSLLHQFEILIMTHTCVYVCVCIYMCVCAAYYVLMYICMYVFVCMCVCTEQMYKCTHQWQPGFILRNSLKWLIPLWILVSPTSAWEAGRLEAQRSWCCSSSPKAIPWQNSFFQRGQSISVKTSPGWLRPVSPHYGG